MAKEYNTRELGGEEINGMVMEFDRGGITFRSPDFWQLFCFCLFVCFLFFSNFQIIG
jgi:hypothetical protein